jgi:hypothetical protein
MNIEDFECLKDLSVNGIVSLTQSNNYAVAIYESNIPYKPGVYLVYNLNEKGENQDLLYYGKAGVTNNLGNPILNFHQLPKRLLASTPIPVNHPEFGVKKDITRALLWPWLVKNKFTNGIKIFWFITDWPKQNPNDFEKLIKKELYLKYPKWKKSL